MKTHFPLMAMAALACTLWSCSNEPDKPNPPLPDASPIHIKAEYEAKVLSQKQFALDLFKAALAEAGGENILLSPYSVNTALGMAWNGAAGTTATQLQQVLGNEGYTPEQINNYARTLTSNLLAVDPSTELKIANSAWAGLSTPFKTKFVETNKTYYNAEVCNVDFGQPATLRQIDSWCRDHTAGKISSISDGMSSQTCFALINAMYFKAIWRSQFDKKKTRTEAFTSHQGSTATVQMMSQTESLQYTDDGSQWKMLRMPYGNGAFGMVILMPYHNEPLDQKMAGLSIETYNSLLASLRAYEVSVKLPRFKAEYSYRLHEKILPAMGLEQLFDPTQANLSLLCDSPMYVSLVTHKTYIDVYEEGTQAAAATSVSGQMMLPAPGTPINFFVNRPFVYAIMENSTGTILLMGRMNHM